MRVQDLFRPATVEQKLGDHAKRIRTLEFRTFRFTFQIRKSTITFDQDLATGVELFTPGVDSVLYDAFVVIREAFNDSGVSGNTDLRFFLGGTQWTIGSFDVGFGIRTVDDTSGGLAVNTGTDNLGQQLLQRAADLTGYGRISAPVLTADPLIAQVSAYAGDGSTGQADIYILTGTPT